MSDDSQYPVRSTGETLRLGLRGKCPRCSHGEIFQSYLKVADQCKVCGLVLTGHDAGDAAVTPAILLIGSLVVGMAFYVEMKYQPPYWIHAVLWIPLATLATMVIIPAFKGMAIAMQHKLRSTSEPGNIGGF